MNKNANEQLPELFPMPFDYVKNIFQIGNPHIYSNASDTQQVAIFMNDCRSMLESMDSKFSTHFGSNMNWTEGGFKIVCEANNGASIVTAEYCVTNEETHETEQRLAILYFAFVDIPTADGKTVQGLKPYFSLNSRITDGEGFVPEECLFRTCFGDEEMLYGAEKTEEFVAGMCYCETALELIILGETPDIQTCQAWFECIDSSGTMAVFEHFDYLTQRDARCMTEQLLECSSSLSSDSPESPPAYPSFTLQ